MPCAPCAEQKPVVAQVGTLAASAGYMIASASDHIVARQSSIVGSIGVLVQFPDVTGLMDKLGVKLEEVKSSPLKAEPSPFNPTTEEERAMIRADDPGQLRLVRRHWSTSAARSTAPRCWRLADGSVFTGRQALANKLVDSLGGEKEAIAWLRHQGRLRLPEGHRVEAERQRQRLPVLGGGSRGIRRGAGLAGGRRAILTSAAAPTACSLTVSCRSGTLEPAL